MPGRGEGGREDIHFIRSFLPWLLRFRVVVLWLGFLRHSVIFRNSGYLLLHCLRVSYVRSFVEAVTSTIAKGSIITQSVTVTEEQIRPGLQSPRQHNHVVTITKEQTRPGLQSPREHSHQVTITKGQARRNFLTFFWFFLFF